MTDKVEFQEQSSRGVVRDILRAVAGYIEACAELKLAQAETVGLGTWQRGYQEGMDDADLVYTTESDDEG